jgi:polo-like kinase 1
MKLANYFIDSSFKLKLGDFGLATFDDDLFRQKRTICGTPNYIAPEVVEKKEYGFEVDLWATGVIM